MYLYKGRIAAVLLWLFSKVKLRGELMRVDKYLKNSRLIKRRTVAKEACEQSRVKINGKIAKPGSEVAVGDMIEIEFGVNPMKIRVEKILEHVKKDDAKDMYSIV